MVGGDEVGHHERVDARATLESLTAHVLLTGDRHDVDVQLRVVHVGFLHGGALRLHGRCRAGGHLRDREHHARSRESVLARDVHERTTGASERCGEVGEELRDDETGECGGSDVALLDLLFLRVTCDALTRVEVAENLRGEGVTDERVLAVGAVGALFLVDLPSADLTGLHLVAFDLAGEFGGGDLTGLDVGDLRDALVEFIDLLRECGDVRGLDFGDVAILFGGAVERRVDEVGLLIPLLVKR